MLIRVTFISIVITSLFISACKTGSTLQDNTRLPRIENVTFEQKSDTVAVFYDLLAKSKKSRFDVNLFLSLGSDNNYEIEPKYASGDIGKGILPGNRKKILWNALKEFPNGLKGNNIQFIVNARKVNNNKKWYYIAGGALLIGTGATIGLLLDNSGDSGLPLPPSRPAGN